jgi:hypothetical protein
MMAVPNKRPYQKPALIELGKVKIDQKAFENGDLGDMKEEILRKIRIKKVEDQSNQSDPHQNE